MKNIIFKSIVVLGIVFSTFGLFSFNSTKADTVEEDLAFYYVFHLYYDKGQLSADRDFEFKYDIIPDVFVQPSVGQFPFRGEIISFTNEVAGNFQFDVKQGKISVNAPYVADGQKAIFYDHQNQPVLTITVSESSFCNDDGICNADRGENSSNCSNDCKNSSLATPLPTDEVAATEGSSGLLSGILYALGGLVLLGLGWWFFFRRKNSDGPILPPPTNFPSSGSGVDMPSSSNQNNPVQ
jgi:LPXTG-motif cell wall-anchored protein